MSGKSGHETNGSVAAADRTLTPIIVFEELRVIRERIEIQNNRGLRHTFWPHHVQIKGISRTPLDHVALTNKASVGNIASVCEFRGLHVQGTALKRAGVPVLMES